MNGRQVAEAARAIRPDLKILFILAMRRMLPSAMATSGMQVMAKPFVTAALANKVRQLMEETCPQAAKPVDR